MKEGNGAVLAFDTSNYTTSVSVVDLEGGIIADCRELLDVKRGERGLRQSEAVFMHVKNLPKLTAEAMESARAKKAEICAAAASSRPRSVEGSYMPCFTVGTGFGSSIAAVLGVPFMEFSHQEGHIAAAAGVPEENSRTLVFHMSGGTSEVLKVQGCKYGGIVGGTSDISYGQLLDRTGTAMGMQFPCGAELDGIACQSTIEYRFSRAGRFVPLNPLLCDISVKDGFVNLSGIETRVMGTLSRRAVAELFFRIGDSMLRMLCQCKKKTGISEVLCVGGVSASVFLRNYLTKRQAEYGLEISFGAPELSSDNAVGIGRLGAHYLQEPLHTAESGD